MRIGERQNLTRRILAHMRAQVADTRDQFLRERAQMHNPLVQGRQAWLGWHFKALNTLHALRTERRMLQLVEKGVAIEAVARGYERDFKRAHFQPAEMETIDG